MVDHCEDRIYWEEEYIAKGLILSPFSIMVSVYTTALVGVRFRITADRDLTGMMEDEFCPMYPKVRILDHGQVSNPQPSDLMSGALPTALSPSQPFWILRKMLLLT